jgi:hypothetical protein
MKWKIIRKIFRFGTILKSEILKESLSQSYYVTVGDFIFIQDYAQNIPRHKCFQQSQG